MLRVNFFTSIGLHVLALGMISLFVSPQDRTESQTEREFRVDFQKQIYSINSIPADAQQANGLQPPAAQALEQHHETVSAHPTSPILHHRTAMLKQPPKKQRRPPGQSVKRTPAPTAPRPIQKTRPQTRETIANAQKFPTPTSLPTPRPTSRPTAKPIPTVVPTVVPTPVPTRQPTMRPTPVPTAIPTPKSTRQALKPVDTSSAAASPAATQTNRESSETDVRKTVATEQAAGPNAFGKSAAAGTTSAQNVEQVAQTVLEAYLQDIVKRIAGKKKYPRQARKKGWEGTVVVKMRILHDGSLEDMNIETSSGYATLDKAALKAIKKAAPFSTLPSELNLPLIRVNVPIQFALN